MSILWCIVFLFISVFYPFYVLPNNKWAAYCVTSWSWQDKGTRLPFTQLLLLHVSKVHIHCIYPRVEDGSERYIHYKCLCSCLLTIWISDLSSENFNFIHKQNNCAIVPVIYLNTTWTNRIFSQYFIINE